MARRRQVATIGFADEGLSGQFESIRASVTEVESWLDGMSTEEYISSLIDRINTEVNATGGYTYIVEGIGLRTYDVAVSDPAVGTEANAVVEMRGGTIRIANTKDAQGNWEWKTVFTSGHIAGELVTAAQIITGYIGSAGGTYIDLDNNVVHLGGEGISNIDLQDDSMTVTNPDGETVMKVLASGIQATTRVEVAAVSGGFRYTTEPTSNSSAIDVSGATPGSAISWSVPGEFRLGVQASLSNITSTFSGYIVRTGTITPYRYDLYNPTSGTFTAGTSATLSWSISGSYTLSGTTYNVTATYSIDYDATAGTVTATATLSGANTSDYIIRWYSPHVVFNGSMDAPSFLLGTTDATLGGFATAVGADVEASGDYSFAEGNGSTASGIYSIAMGHEAEATANSAFALGYHASANGASSTALGGGTVADSDYQTVLGRYNESDPNSDYLFILGNGTADNARSNALTVDWDGNVAAESFNLWHGQRTLSSADNIDSLFESGIFYLPGSVPGGTYPSGANGQYASLLSMGNTAEYSSTGWVGRQILVQGAGGVWHRSYSGSPRAWTDWKPLDESSHPTEIAASSLTLTGCSLNGASTIPAYKIGRHVTINMRVNVTAANPTIAGFPATSGANSHIPVIAYRQSDNSAIAGYMTNAGVVTFPALASGSNIMFHVDYIASS